MTQGERMTRKLSVKNYLICCTVAALVVTGCYLMLGPFPVSAVDLLRIIGGGNSPTAPAARFIIVTDRGPRIVLALLVGAALGLAGSWYQNILRNPLASPDIVGISSASSLAVVAGMAFAGASGFALVGWALAGATVAVLIIGTALGGTPWRSISGSATVGNTAILAGIALSAVCLALTQFLLSRLNIYQASGAIQWISGSLSGATWLRVGIVAAALSAALVIAAFSHRALTHFLLGDALSFSLGVPVIVVRWGLIAAATALSAIAVASTGPLAFVAFSAGPIARRFTGERASVFSAALTGAVLVATAEYVGSSLLPFNLPAGVLTGAVGVPLMLSFVLKSTRETA